MVEIASYRNGNKSATIQNSTGQFHVKLLFEDKMITQYTFNNQKEANEIAEQYVGKSDPKLLTE